VKVVDNVEKNWMWPLGESQSITGIADSDFTLIVSG